jgi:protein SCO1/2
MRAFLIILTLLMPCLAKADDDPTAFSWQQHPGAQVSLDTKLRDERGHAVALSGVFTNTPVILDLGYFHCPALCGVVRADLFNALHGSGLVAGRDYSLVSISIDPTETPGDASQAKAADVAQAGLGDGANWHYLTGDAGAVSAIADAVGFRDKFDARYKQFMHPAGVAVLTKDGRVSSYLLGVGYSAGDLRAAVLRGRDGGVAQASLPILLLCFHFDPATGRYTLAIEKVLRLMAGLTVVTLAGVLILLHRRRPRGWRA